MFRLIDKVLFTLERLWQHRVLVLWALVGLSAATTLALSLTLYVDVVNTGLLESRLSDPPYAFRFRYYLGGRNAAITQDDVNSASAAIQNTFTGIIGLPTARQVSYLRGGAWTVRLNNKTSLGALNIGTLQGADEQITITAGKWPAPAPGPNDPIPALITEKMLYDKGVKVGDTLSATLAGAKPIKLTVAAVWRPTNANDPSWIFTPKFFDDVLLVEPDQLSTALQGISKPIEEAAWYLIFDGSAVKTSDVDALIGRIIDGLRSVTSALPGIRLDVSPQDNLTAFSQEVSRLTQQLVIMILPVSGVVLYFVTLVASLLVSRQQQEDVTLRSRGMSRLGILSVHVLMWLILAGIALAIGLAASPFVVRLVGRTTSFLRFDDVNSNLVPILSLQAIEAGVLTSLLAISSGLFLAWRTTGQNINSFRQSSARASRAWWQRMYLDVLLLIPALYVLYTLKQQGGLVTSAENPFSDPLTFLGPTLFSLGLTLLFLRVWPFMMRLGGGIIAYTSNVSLLMALRELARSIGRYRGTLLMMCFTLSLIGFTASMASTLDKSLEDSVDYKIGANAVLITAVDAQTDQSTASDGTQTTTVTGFNAPPVDDLYRIDGVNLVSRVGRYPGRLVLASKRVDGTILGVDRAAMAAVALSRPDYADMDMGDVFNRLAGNRTGIIMNSKAAKDNNLRIGQEVTLQVSALNTWYDMKVPIVGLVNYFPTLDPKGGFFAITNIDPIFETVGTYLPYDVWMSLKPSADPNTVQQKVRESGFPVVRWLDPNTALEAARSAPSRRGVLGFLSVGFVASIVLTLVGAVIQNAASFRAQAAQLGSLRAMGLSGGSVGSYLILVQGMAASSGVLSGTFIGVGTTLLFLPLLDFSGGLPPYLIRVAWNDIITVYAVFAGVLFSVILFTTILMGRQSLSVIVRLGEA